MLFPNLHKEKFLNFKNLTFWSLKFINLGIFINLMKNLSLLNDFWDYYDLSLFISVKAFLPSLRVLKTSQDREKMIRKVSEIREIKVVSILIFNLQKFIQSLTF